MITRFYFTVLLITLFSFAENPEIDASATQSEIKAAYRRMAKKYHPDKVLHLGKEHQKGAEEKFRKVQEAYEQLQK